MSKNNNLTDFLIEVADAIRTRKGYESSVKINPQDFGNEIIEIPEHTGLKVTFESVYELPEDPEEDKVYLLFDVPNYIPDELPDVEVLTKLVVKENFDPMYGNIMDENAVTLFSYLDGNASPYPPTTVSWLNLTDSSYSLFVSLNSNMSVVNIGKNQAICRVALYDSNWKIFNYRSAGTAIPDNIPINDTLQDDSEE